VSAGSKLRALVGVELRRFTTIQASDRAWQMRFAAALASGLPLLIGAYFNHMDHGLVSSLGGRVFLYFGLSAGVPDRIFLQPVYVASARARQVAPLPPPTFDLVVFDGVVIGAFVGISLAAAQALDLQNGYWVPVSCLAVIQGASMHAVWTKQLHRVLGTSIGLLVSWGLLLLPLDKWSISLAMMAMTFVIELTVVRHYGFAAVFITPLTILLAEAATLGQGPASALIEARFFDTVLGCFIGLVGGFCLHSQRFRDAVGGQMRRLIPSDLSR
jgi:uncharacterized membrane protein YccC